MEITFETTELRDLCESQAKAEKLFGLRASRGLRACLSDVRASSSLSDFAKIRTLLTEGDKFSVNFGENLALEFSQGHLVSPQKSGVLDLSKVRRVKILNVGSQDA